MTSRAVRARSQRRVAQRLLVYRAAIVLDPAPRLIEQIQAPTARVVGLLHGRLQLGTHL